MATGLTPPPGFWRAIILAPRLACIRTISNEKVHDELGSRLEGLVVIPQNTPVLESRPVWPWAGLLWELANGLRRAFQQSLAQILSQRLGDPLGH